MPEADSEREVYYDDLINPPTKPERPSPGPKAKETEVNTITAGASAPVKVPAREKAVSNPLKRQRTLVDMFGGSSVKKTKVDGSSFTVVSKSQTLNSIPFNLDDYINSLTEEQRGLLGLEIETMGKIWSVPMSQPLSTPFQYCMRLFSPTIHLILAANPLHTAQAKTPA